MTDDRVEKKSPWWPSIVAIIVSVLSLWLSYEAYKITERVAKPLVYSPEASFSYLPKARRPNYVAVKLQNYGQTPAYDITTRFDIEVLPKGNKLKRTFKTEDKNTEVVLARDDWTLVHYQLPNEVASKEEMGRIKSGSHVFFFYGETVYQGRVGAPYQWCWKYKPDLKEFWRCDPDDFQK